MKKRLTNRLNSNKRLEWRKLRVRGAISLISTPFFGFIILFSLSIKLLWIWFTVDMKIWKARRGFEKEIVR